MKNAVCDHRGKRIFPYYLASSPPITWSTASTAWKYLRAKGRKGWHSCIVHSRVLYKLFCPAFG